jgi:hypothetical protein
MTLVSALIAVQKCSHSLEKFAAPHADALDKQKTETVGEAIEVVSEQLSI